MQKTGISAEMAEHTLRAGRTEGSKREGGKMLRLCDWKDKDQWESI